jgi:hypothetical protein
MHELTVLRVLRRRRRGSKEPFYYVTIQGPRGDDFEYQVSDAGARVEPEEDYWREQGVLPPLPRAPRDDPA